MEAINTWILPSLSQLISITRTEDVNSVSCTEISPNKWNENWALDTCGCIVNVNNLTKTNKRETTMNIQECLYEYYGLGEKILL